MIDLAQEKVIQNIPVGNNPRSIVLSPDEKWLYVDNYGSGSVSIIDLKQGKEVAMLNAGLILRTVGQYCCFSRQRHANLKRAFQDWLMNLTPI